MKIHNVEQNSVDWLILRSGRVTASEMDNLVTPLGKVKTGEGPKTYLTQKLAEAWIGGPLPSVQGVFDIDQGKILEEYAKPAFTLETGFELENVGFITGDNDFLGCSPDGILKGKQAGVEIKCPAMPNHIKYLLDGKCPTDYVLQVQASMFITGFHSWYFYSYRRNFPSLILQIGRDETIQAAIAEAVDNFQQQFKAGLEKLVKLNGGYPDERFRGLAPFPGKTYTEPMKKTMPTETNDDGDIIP